MLPKACYLIKNKECTSLPNHESIWRIKCQICSNLFPDDDQRRGFSQRGPRSSGGAELRSQSSPNQSSQSSPDPECKFPADLQICLLPELGSSPFWPILRDAVWQQALNMEQNTKLEAGKPAFKSVQPKTSPRPTSNYAIFYIWSERHFCPYTLLLERLLEEGEVECHNNIYISEINRIIKRIMFCKIYFITFSNDNKVCSSNIQQCLPKLIIVWEEYHCNNYKWGWCDSICLPEYIAI